MQFTTSSALLLAECHSNSRGVWDLEVVYVPEMWASPCLPSALCVSCPTTSFQVVPSAPPACSFMTCLWVMNEQAGGAEGFVLDFILLQTQLSSSLSLHMFLRLPNPSEIVTSQSQHFVPHFPDAISQNWATQKSCSPSTLFDSFFLYIFLIQFFFLLPLEWDFSFLCSSGLQVQGVKQMPPNPLINFNKVRGTDFSKYR